MMSENKRNLTEKEDYYKLITDEKSNHIGTNANGAGSQCVRRKNIGSLSFRERYLSLRKKEQSARVALFVYAIRVLTFFQSLRFMKAPLRVEREYQMKPRGRVFYQPREKTIVRKSSHWDIGQTWND